MSRAVVVITLAAAMAGLAPAAEPPQKNPFAKPAFMNFVEDAPAALQSDQPAEALSLKATLVAEGRAFANIGGVVLAPGEEHAGYRLLSVSEGKAVLERNGERVVLMLFQEPQDE